MFRPLLQMLRNKQLLPALAANALYRPFYRLSFLAALSASGLMARLADGPIPLAQLAAGNTAGDAAGAREALRAWLQMGCRLGLLQVGPGDMHCAAWPGNWRGPKTTPRWRWSRKRPACITA
ncbi:hypothetical protein WJ973_16790 [Achromobacter xylosoxidans]